MGSPSQSEQADTLTSEPGATLGPRGPGEPRYDVRELLARGGQSEVYVAFDRDLGREVAFKRPRPDARGQVPAGLEARFLREARINARLDHPNVITVHEIGRDAVGLFCTQRLVRSGDRGPPKTFAQALAATTSLAERLALLPRFLDVCTGVAHAHGRGISHRDLKPDNVVLGGPNETVVLDWGLARDSHQADAPADTESGESLHTVDGQVFGTPRYMSPEQAFGQRDLVDARSDVWSLGIMLFELLTGRTPFVGLTPVAVIEEVRHAALPSPLDFTPEAPPALAAVVMRALARERPARYPAADSLAAEVRAFLENRQVQVYDYSFVELARMFLRRYRTTALVGGVALGLLLVALAALGLATARARTSLSEAFVEKARLADSSLRWNEAAIWYAAALEQSAREDAQLGFQLAVRRAAAQPVTRLVGHRLGVRALATSPDETVLASAGTDGIIRLWDPQRGPPQRELRGHTEAVTGLAFSPDGQVLYSVSEDHTLRRWEVEGGQGAVMATLPDTLNAVVATPDGTAVLAACELGQIFRVPTDGGPARVFGQHSRPVYALALSPDGAELASGSWGGDLKRWRLADGTLIDSLTMHTGAVLALAYSPDGTRLASAGKDTTVRVWALRPDATIHEQLLSGHSQRVYGVAWDHTSTLLASVSTDGTSRVWRALTGVPLRSMSLGESDELAAVHFLRRAPTGNSLVWAGRSGVISVRAVEAPAASTNHLLTQTLSLLPSGTMLLSLESTFALVDPATLEPSFTGPVGHDALGGFAPLGAIAASRSGRLAAGSCGQDCLAYWDLGEQRLLGRTRGHGTGNEAVAFAPDERLLASVGRDSAIRIWDVATRVERRTLRAHADGSYGVAWSPDGRWLATSGYDKHIILWETAGFTEVRRFEGHEHGVRTITFSPDSRLLASASWDRSARVWDVATGQERARFHHQDFVFGVDFRPDGKVLATASHDGTVRLWDLQGQRELVRFISDEAQATAVKFSVDGGALFYAGRSLHRIDLRPRGDEPTLARLLEQGGLRLDGVNLTPVR